VIRGQFLGDLIAGVTASDHHDASGWKVARAPVATAVDLVDV
jgi:hypothetical protein